MNSSQFNSSAGSTWEESGPSNSRRTNGIYTSPELVGMKNQLAALSSSILLGMNAFKVLNTQFEDLREQAMKYKNEGNIAMYNTSAALLKSEKDIINTKLLHNQGKIAARFNLSHPRANFRPNYTVLSRHEVTMNISKTYLTT